MLDFFSASTRMVNSQRAIMECMEIALGDRAHDCDLVIINASIGHHLNDLVSQVRQHSPHARVVATTCAGVVGREGVSESMKDVAIMAIRGREFNVAYVDQIYGSNSYEKSVQLASQLKNDNSAINMIYLVAPGIDIANDKIVAGFESVFGPDVKVFGANSSDNMRGIISYQAVDDQLFEHAAFAVGFSDPTLTVDTCATHGFVAVGEPLIVTRSEGHRIIELNGKPAWSEYLARLGLPDSASEADTIPIGALAELLPTQQAQLYGNTHILRAVTHHDETGAIHYATTCATGTHLWLTCRDEGRIFSDLDRMTFEMQHFSKGRKPIAVFQADCLARGRLLFNRVMKEELVQRMQHPFSQNGMAPPWLGMYGFGEFASLGRANTFHNYTTALAAIYRN